MAIKMRRGNLDDFNPAKMSAGEWAVSTDAETSKQKVYMAFAPGVVKEMMTATDAAVMVEETKAARDEAVTAKNTAVTSATNASTSETNAGNSATLSQSWAVGGTNTRTGEDTNNAKYWAEQAQAQAGGDFCTNTTFNAHKNGSVVSNDGEHGLRYNATEEVLQAYVDGEWVDCGGAMPTSQITVTTTSAEFVGKDVVLTKGSTEIARETFDATKVVIFPKLVQTGTYTVTCYDDSKEVVIDALGVNYPVVVEKDYATIVATVNSEWLVGYYIVAKNLYLAAKVEAEGFIDSSLTTEMKVKSTGEYTVVVYGKDGEGTVISDIFDVNELGKKTYNCTFDSPHQYGLAKINVTTSSAELFNKKVYLNFKYNSKEYNADSCSFNNNSVSFVSQAYPVYSFFVECEGYKSAEITLTAGQEYNLTVNTASTITLTVEGAKEDNITIYDTNGTVVDTLPFGSGQTTGTIELAIPSEGVTYKFESSVAKDTETGTENYSKNVNLTNSSTSVKCMPEGALYWYGNECVLKWYREAKRGAASASVNPDTNSITVSRGAGNDYDTVSAICSTLDTNLKKDGYTTFGGLVEATSLGSDCDFGVQLYNSNYNVNFASMVQGGMVGAYANKTTGQKQVVKNNIDTAFNIWNVLIILINRSSGTTTSKTYAIWLE